MIFADFRGPALDCRRICHELGGKRVCYKLNYTHVSWTEGRQRCLADGGDFVSIESDSEWHFLLPAIQELPKHCDRFHTSGKKENGQWVWKATGKPFNYTAWGPGEPSGNGDLCVLWKKMQNWTGWDDEVASILSCFIYEFL
ncbi:hypothetical protein LSAT2_010680 [Lamellibrachia satsuma]|nr:hypothetical protein LSAT2_010680 [Lamellibrachia satsuma]